MHNPNDNPASAKSLVAFRNLLTPIGHLQNDPEAILSASGLDWKAHKMPLDIRGSRESRPYGRYAIVHGRTGRPIDAGHPTSASYSPHSNLQLLTDMCNFSASHGLLMSQVGEVKGGEYVIGYASSPHLADISPKNKGYAHHLGDLSKGRNQDLVEAGILLIASHVPGVATLYRTIANRFACSNGVIIGECHEGYRLPHHRNAYQSQSVLAIFSKFRQDFEAYCSTAQALASTPTPPLIQKAYLTETLSPELWDAILTESQAKFSAMPSLGQPRREFYLDALLHSDAIAREFLDSLESKGKRNLHHVLDTMPTQPGVEFVSGTLAEPYQALTHWVDHDRGRNPDASLLSSMAGDGAKLKTHALEVATQYATIAPSWQ